VEIEVDVRRLGDCVSFTTKDGSQIRELLAHRNSCIRNQSLAEATIPVGTQTTAHYHPKSEEIYFVMQGSGEMMIDGSRRMIGPGDAVAIPPGAIHSLHNTGGEPIRILCCCAPGYEHEDTVLVE
jgi:mannose-6-phosphate isomerase-like protein (cupin superfamily)